MATTFAVPDGRVAMAATLWTGDGTTSRSIVNTVNTVSFQPDLIWVKARTTAGVAYGSHSFTDSVRGANLILSSDLTNAEANVVTSFGNGGVGAPTSNGFTLVSGTAGNANNYNANTATFVGWQWKAGGTAVSNTAGTITSSVSANTTAGFSVVTYTGTGANATVGHGLGVAPSMVIIKSRTSAVYNWIVYHSGLTSATYYVSLNQTIAQSSYPTVFNSTAPTSTVFSIGTDASTNQSAGTYVAYCWAPVAGYSAFGSYTGNGSTDGPFVYTGFRPRWIMTKSSSAVEQWLIYDTARDTYNYANLGLLPASSIAESTYGQIDILSNGFKMRGTGSSWNGSGTTYIYAAYAENPLRYSNAR